MQVINTAVQLLESGLEIDLLLIDKSKLYFEAINNKLNTITIDNFKYLSPLQIIKLRFVLNNRKYDIIHSHFSKDLWLLTPVLKWFGFGTPLILTKHVGSFINKKDSLHRYIYSRVDLALAISRVIKKNLEDTTPLKPNKIELLYSGIDDEKFNPEKVTKNRLREEYKLSKDTILIGIAGRFSPGKGHEEFIYACEILAAKHKNLKFIIIGESSYGESKYGKKISEMPAALGIEDNFIFTGFRKDMPEVFNSLDIFVFPSHAEAFGLTLVEAMCMGLPSVCTASDGILDIAVDNETSFLFERENYVELSQKIEQLIISKELRDRFGSNARKRVISMFTKNIYIDNLISLYKRFATK
ncbi:MAG: glycosyltransferase family 4 protein [Melioribacteraceae bacterium]|nr:glycosyltransferase family 4 protein [Melioribacteraceae bacterium]